MLERDVLVAALAEEWAAIDDLVAGFDAGDWRRPTCLPGWDVADVVAHVVGTEAMLLGEPTPESGIDPHQRPHVHNDIAAANEHWVEAARSSSPEELVERYRDVIARRRAALAAMDQAAFDAPSWTPAGQATYGRFMRIRLFDTWMHEQDVREAVDQPGHEGGRCAEGALDEIESGLGYIVGKRAGAPDESSVTVELTGAAPRTTHVAVAGRARVVEQLDGPATATLRLGSTLFTRLAGGRLDPATRLGEVTIGGDADLGRQVATHLAFTI